MTIEIVVPQVGEAVAEIRLVAWLKDAGDPVKKGDTLFELDTDKVVVEVDAFTDGTLVEILVPADTAVVPLQVVALLEPEGETDLLPAVPDHRDEEPRTVEAVFDDEQASPVVRRVAAQLNIDLGAIEGTGRDGRITVKDVQRFAAELGVDEPTIRGVVSERILATPKARRLARELGVDLADVVGTGVGGMITTEDVHLVAQTGEAVTPSPFATQRLPELQPPSPMWPTSKMRDAIARRMTLSKTTIPHFYLLRDVNMARAAQLREDWVAPGVDKPSYTAIVLRACALALLDFPGLNVNLREGEFFPRQSIDIGIAVAVERDEIEGEKGLVVPTMRDVDRKTLQEINVELAEMIVRARSARLRPEDMEPMGRSLVITNLGMYSVDVFVPIIDPPDPMILALGAVGERPWVEDGELAVRLVVTLALAADHRIMDGVAGARFLDRVCVLLEQPALL
jgi:pyruvate dehydrogenase E2 component (dihydrolipoamide acetyltransferase)